MSDTGINNIRLKCHLLRAGTCNTDDSNGRACDTNLCINIGDDVEEAEECGGSLVSGLLDRVTALLLAGLALLAAKGRCTTSTCERKEDEEDNTYPVGIAATRAAKEAAMAILASILELISE